MLTVDPAGAAARLRARAVAAFGGALVVLVLLCAGAQAAAWRPPLDLPGPADRDAGFDVAAAPDGTVVAVWTRTTEGKSQVMGSVRPPGGAFSTPEPLGAPSGGFPRVTVDGRGDATVVWEQHEGNSALFTIEQSTRPAGGSFLAPQPLSSPTAEANPAIHPGAREIRGNAVDENCDKVKEPFPKVSANASLVVLFGRGFVQLKTLKVSALERRDTVKLSCKGGGCRRSLRATIRIKRKTRLLLLTKRVKSVRLDRRARLTVRVSHPGFVARIFRFTVKRLGDVPEREELCQPPGAKRPRGC